jgi:long-chain acyl-CoA synthetase
VYSLICLRTEALVGLLHQYLDVFDDRHLPSIEIAMFMDSNTTFPRLLLDHAARRPDAAALREKRFGIWQTLTWADFAALAGELAGGLAQAGVQHGDHVVVIGENRPRLYATMLAAQSLGAVPVPLYQDAMAAELVFPIVNAEVAHAVVEDQEQVDKLLEVREQCPRLSHIWFDDPRGLRHYGHPGLAPLDTLVAAGRDYLKECPGFHEAEVQRTQPNDVAAMFFTSGTTGQPKGVVHTHATLIDRALAGARFDKLTHHEELLAYLPIAWIGQNIFSYAQWLTCGYVVNCPESPHTVTIDLKEIGPTYYFAPPRVLEALLTSVLIRMKDASAVKRWLFDGCMSLARRTGAARMAGKSIGVGDTLLCALAEWLMFAPLRNALGFSRVRVAYTAGEAIGPDLFVFYRAIGVNLKQLYGSTETAVFVCLQPDHQVRADTVGVPIEGVQVKVADGGEVLVQSPGLMVGYYKDPAATAAVLDADGWYRTGDAGFLDANGHLKIIDRARDVGRIAGGAHDGALFAPKYVENKLKFFPYIKEAVAFGDRRAQVCVLINIDTEAVGDWAERHNLTYGGYAELAQKPEVGKLIRECVEQVNAGLALDSRLLGSQISRFLILHKELDADDGELTRTRKVRREFIGERYRILVDALYEGRTSQYIESTVRFEDGRTNLVSADLCIMNAKTFAAAGADA